MGLRLTPIIPRNLNAAGIQHALIDGMRDVGERIREDFEDTTRTWNHRVGFVPTPVIPKVGTDAITVTTETGDKIYGYVSDGTPSHPIFPRNAKALAFPGTFIPKTFPGVIGSGSGFSGGGIELRKWVGHPGIEARKFDTQIKEKREKDFTAILKNAMKIARKASGHAL